MRATMSRRRGRGNARPAERRYGQVGAAGGGSGQQATIVLFEVIVTVVVMLVSCPAAVSPSVPVQ
jgi:hypothetical protein